MNLSIILPAFNEEKSIKPLYQKLSKMLSSHIDLIPQYEIIFVNDGSTDGTEQEIQLLKDKCVKLITLPVNSGKSAALFTGFRKSRFEVIVTLDCDLQDDPTDIPGMILKMDEGYDCVCGWRDRKASGFIKDASSLIANYVRRHVLKDGIHDSSSPLKLIKKEILENMFFFKGFHRFIPYLTIVQGYKVCEVRVEQHPRQFGESKFNTAGRLSKTIIDLLIMVWFRRNRIRIHEK